MNVSRRKVDLGRGREMYLHLPYAGPRAWLLLVIGGVRNRAMYRIGDAMRDRGAKPPFWSWVFRVSNRALLAVAPPENLS